jgi:hypothetical protein
MSTERGGESEGVKGNMVRNQPLKSGGQLSFAADGSISGCLRDGSRARRDRGLDSPSRCRKSPIVLGAGQAISGRSRDKRANNLRGPQVGLCLRNAATASVTAGSIAAALWRAELRIELLPRCPV